MFEHPKLEERLAAVREAAKDDSFCWVAGCGGTEVPFVKNGKTYLYMWNYKSRVHAYYCVTDDVFIDAMEWNDAINNRG